MKTLPLLLLLLLLTAACSRASGQDDPNGPFVHPPANAELSLPELPDAPAVGEPVVKNDFEWNEALDDEPYPLLR